MKLQIPRVLGQKLLRLLESQRKFLPFPQDLDVVDVNARIIWFELQRAFEQKFGIVKNAEAQTNLCKQPHTLDMMRHFLQELAAQVLGLEQPSLGDKIHNRQERCRQFLQRLEIRSYLGSLRLVSGPRQDVEPSLPAGDKCRVVAAGSRICRQREVGLAHVAVSVSFLLVGAAILRRQKLEAPQQVQRDVEIALVAVTDGAHVQRVHIVRVGIESSAKLVQCLVKLPGDNFFLDGC